MMLFDIMFNRMLRVDCAHRPHQSPWHLAWHQRLDRLEAMLAEMPMATSP